MLTPAPDIFASLTASLRFLLTPTRPEMGFSLDFLSGQQWDQEESNWESLGQCTPLPPNFKLLHYPYVENTSPASEMKTLRQDEVW